MKKFTTKEQTQCLIKLGFPGPCSISDFEEIVDYPGTTVIFDYDYSIGDLIEFLPKNEWAIFGSSEHIEIVTVHHELECGKCHTELIDALFDACVELKIKGVIDPMEE